MSYTSMPLAVLRYIVRRPYYAGLAVCLCGMAAYAATLVLVVAMSGSLMSLESQANVLQDKVIGYYTASQPAQLEQQPVASSPHENSLSAVSTRAIIEWPPKVASAR